MASIKGGNTKPEIIVRKHLYKKGIRYRLHRKDITGKPDIYIPSKKLVIFVNGCFWHMHDCSLFKLPKSNTSFWREKLIKNKKRDAKNYETVQNSGYRLAIIWECSLKNKNIAHQSLNNLIKFINSDQSYISIE